MLIVESSGRNVLRSSFRWFTVIRSGTTDTLSAGLAHPIWVPAVGFKNQCVRVSTSVTTETLGLLTRRKHEILSNSILHHDI